MSITLVISLLLFASAQAALTFTCSADKVYDGTTVATFNNVKLVGVIPGDQVTLTGLTGTFANKNVGNGKIVTITDYTLGGPDAGKYILSLPSITASITVAQLTVTAAGSNKVYDGNTIAAITLTTDKLRDDVVVPFYTTATFDSKNTGKNKSVTVSGISIAGADASNYTTYVKIFTTADVTVKDLAVNAIGVNKSYDGNTTASVNLITDKLSADAVTPFYATASFDNRNVGKNKPVAVDGITITGADAGNYSANTKTGTVANVTVKALTVTALGDDKEYDGSTIATVRLSTDKLVEDVVTPSYSSAVFSNKIVGTKKIVTVYGISITGADAGNYSVNTTTTTSADITIRILKVSAMAENKVYDGGILATVNLTTDKLSQDVVITSYSAAVFDTKNVGKGKIVTVTGISISGTDASNYTANSRTETTAEITIRELVVSAIGVNKVYDANTIATVTLTTNKFSADAVTPFYTTASFDNKNVGKNKPVAVDGITITGADVGNYTANTKTATIADITLKNLTVIAHGVDRDYDGTIKATVTLTIDKLVEDVVNPSYASATFTNKHANKNKIINVEGITITGADAGNYTANATAVTVADIFVIKLKVSAIADNKVYDGGLLATVNLTNDKLSGDDVVTSYTASVFETKNVGKGKTVLVTSISISGPDAPNYTANARAETTADITIKELVVSAIGVNKVYDGNTIATVNLTTNKFSADAVTPFYTSASFDNKHVGVNKPVTVEGITITGADAGNYTANTSAVTVAEITHKALNVIAHGDDKDYDGNTKATVTFTTDKLLEDVVFPIYTSAAFTNKHANKNKIINVEGITLTGADAGNYTANTTAFTVGDVFVIKLKVSAIADNKVYDGGLLATINLTNDKLSGDDVVTSYTASVFETKNVGKGKTVFVTSISISGPDAPNYTANARAETTADITVKELVVSAVGVNKVYDGTTTATVTLLTDKFSSDAVTPFHTTALFDNKNVGKDKPITVEGITITGADAGNYTANTTTATIANITVKTLIVIAHGDDKDYDGNATATVTLTTDKLLDDVVIPSYTSASFTNKHANKNKIINVEGITITGADAGNYTSNITAVTVADIFVIKLKVTAMAENKVYDGSLLAIVTLTTDKLSQDVVITSYTNSVFDTKNVGKGKTVTVTSISISGPDAPNYTANARTETTADITVKDLVVSAIGVNKVYDGNTIATVTLTTDKFSSDAVTPYYTSASFNNKNVGEHKPVTVVGITITGADAGNYTANTTAVTFADITLKILNVTAHGVDEDYDGNTKATVTLTTDKVLTDVVTPSYTSAAFSSKNVGTKKLVTVNGISITGADAGNYTANVTTTTSADITVKVLKVTAKSVDKVYDGNATTTVTLTTDKLSEDVVNPSYTTATFDNKNVGNNKPVTVTEISISGTDAGNYTVNATTGTTANIKGKALTINVIGKDKVYDGTTTVNLDTLSATLSGIISSDIVTLNNSIATGEFIDENVDKGKVVTTAGFSIGGTDAGNYTFVNPVYIASITAKTLIITSNSISKCFGALTTFNGTEFTTSGMIGNETVTGLTLVSDGTSASAKVGSYDIVASNAVGSANLSNYAINYLPGTMTVNPIANQPADFAVSTSSVCQGATGIAYTVPVDPLVTYTWTYSGSGVTFTGSTNAITMSFSPIATAGTLSVTANTACGTSTARTMAIAVNPAQTTPLITEDALYHVSLTSSATTGNQWYNAAGIIAGATNPIYTATQNDTYYVMVTGNCSILKSNSITVTHVSVPEFEKPIINVYPNPGNGEFWVKFKALGNEKLRLIQVFNRLGKAVYQAIPSSLTNDFTDWVSIKTQPAGVYILVMTTDIQRISRQIIITK